MNLLRIVFLLLILVPVITLADDDRVIDVDMSKYGTMTVNTFKRSALLALMLRDWDITSVAPDRFVGEQRGYKVEITLKGQMVHIVFLPESGTKAKYLTNLEKDLIVEFLRMGE